MSCAESTLSSFSTPTVDDVRGGHGSSPALPMLTSAPPTGPVPSSAPSCRHLGPWEAPHLSLPVSCVFPPVTLRGWAGSPEPGGTQPEPLPPRLPCPSGCSCPRSMRGLRGLPSPGVETPSLLLTLERALPPGSCPQSRACAGGADERAGLACWAHAAPPGLKCCLQCVSWSCGPVLGSRVGMGWPLCHAGDPAEDKPGCWEALSTPCTRDSSSVKGRASVSV